MNKIDAKLAIIIPAYKAKFLYETLNSIAAQTNKQFNLYICNDNSPEPISDIIKQFENKLCFTYKKFDTNLGRTSLVKQWERCIDITSEEWVWLFSDDDIMEPSCVENFFQYLFLLDRQFDIFRFNTLIIDEKNKIIEISPPHPREEDCFYFLYFFLRGLRSSMMQDHIFARKAFNQYGGFPNFPFAWCSDQALTLRLGFEKGFFTIPKSKIRMRQSGLNISSIKEKSINAAKINALLAFVNWLLDFIEKSAQESFPFSKQEMKKLSQDWLLQNLISLHTYLHLLQMINIAKIFKNQWNEPLWLNLLRMAKININNLTNDIRIFVKAFI